MNPVTTLSYSTSSPLLPPLLPPIPTLTVPSPPPPSNQCPKGFIFEPGFEHLPKSQIGDSWNININQCTAECKKIPDCVAIQWSKKTPAHCVWLRRSSSHSEPYADYIKCKHIGTSKFGNDLKNHRLFPSLNQYFSISTKYFSFFISKSC